MARRLVVVDGATLACSKGSEQQKLQVTTGLPLAADGHGVATVLDALPINMTRFGTCSAVGFPCDLKTAPEWSTIGWGLVLVDDATLPCKRGGVITVTDPGQHALYAGFWLVLSALLTALAKRNRQLAVEQAVVESAKLQYEIYISDTQGGGKSKWSNILIGHDEKGQPLYKTWCNFFVVEMYGDAGMNLKVIDVWYGKRVPKANELATDLPQLRDLLTFTDHADEIRLGTIVAWTGEPSGHAGIITGKDKDGKWLITYAGALTNGGVNVTTLEALDADLKSYGDKGPVYRNWIGPLPSGDDVPDDYGE